MQDIEVAHNPQPYEVRGKLYREEQKAKAFQLRKAQRFQKVEIGAEGSCRIRFQGEDYHLTSCPWLDGFSDHQTDFFHVLPKR